MFTVKKQWMILACLAFSLLLSACQSAPPDNSTPDTQPDPVTAVPTPDDLIKGTLTYGEGKLGNLAGEDEFWVFDGQEGDVIDISMVSASADMDPTFSLIGPSNELLNTVYSDISDVNYEARLNCFELPESGRYVIVASTYHADLMAGSYIVTVQNTADISEETEPTPIELGETAQNAGCGREVETWSYEGETGELIWLQITPDYELDEAAELSGDLDVQVVASDGADAVTEFARYSLEGEELDMLYVLGQDGEYTIRVTASQEKIEPFTIRLTAPLSDGYYYDGTVDGFQFLTLTYPGIGVIPYDVGSSSSNTVNITAVTPIYQQCDRLDVSLNVISPTGLIVAGTSDSETVASDVFPEAIDGTFYFPMGETETYQRLALEQVTLEDVGRYLVALVSLSDEPIYSDDCSYFAVTVDLLDQ